MRACADAPPDRGARFTVLVEPPFVVAGDEPAATVEQRAATIIRRAVLRLRAQYFAADPREIVEVYLLRDAGINSAQARYLCHYLQDRRLLHNFYRQFLRTAVADPTGRTLLLQTVGALDLGQFAAEWRTYVMGLRYG